MPLDEFRERIEPYRRELRAHCYRMLGSIADADETVQDALLKAWRGLPEFAERASQRTWLYKIATNACLDSLARRSHRFVASEATPAGALGDALGEPRHDFIDPCPDSFWQDTIAGPEARVSARQSVALAFVAALERLPPVQRAALLLRDVLDWPASEVAELLDRTPAAIESALQRARASMAREQAAAPAGDLDRELLQRYLAAWENGDPQSIAALLREDATLSMPPYPLWLRGRQTIASFLAGLVPTFGRIRGELVGISGGVGLAMWVCPPGEKQFSANSLTLLTVQDGAIAASETYLGPALFRVFELPVIST